MPAEDRCARHPWFATDSCPFCEARIERAEDAREGHFDAPDRADEVRYERWLDEIGGG
jgi:hypothetical protein